jgi:hypothetical protein
MEIRDICSGTVIGSFQPDLRSGREKRREKRKKERQERWRKIQEYEQIYFGSSNKSRRSAILKRK